MKKEHSEEMYLLLDENAEVTQFPTLDACIDEVADSDDIASDECFLIYKLIKVVKKEVKVIDVK